MSFFEFVFTTMIGVLIFIFLYLSGHQKLQELPAKFSLKFFIFGPMLLCFATIGNSLVENKWSLEYLLNFLKLKEDVGDFVFHRVAHLGYFLIILGLITQIFLLIEKLKNKNNKRYKIKDSHK